MRIIKCSGPRLPTQGQWDEDSKDRQTFPAWVLAFFLAASPSPGIASGHPRRGREHRFTGVNSLPEWILGKPFHTV